jgi:hypothetical protein
MALFGKDDGQSNGGLLGNMDPASKMMLAMSMMGNLNGSNNNGGGFGDMFKMMLQMQNMARQKQMMDFEQRKYNLEESKYNMALKQGQQMMQQGADVGSSILNYKDQPAPQIDPVIPEYDDLSSQSPQSQQQGQQTPMPQALMPGQGALSQTMGNSSGQQQPFLIPSQNYLSNLFSATDKARENPPLSPFVKDAELRKQGAALVQLGLATGKPELVKQGYELAQFGGRKYSSPLSSVDQNTGKEAIIQIDQATGQARPVTGYAPRQRTGTSLSIDPATGQVLFTQGMTDTNLSNLVKDPSKSPGRGGQGGTYVDTQTGKTISTDTNRQTSMDQATITGIKRVMPQIDVLVKNLPQFQRATTQAASYLEGVSNKYFGTNFNLPSKYAEGVAKLESAPEALIKTFGLQSTDQAVDMMKATIKPKDGESPAGYKARVLRALQELKLFEEQSKDRLANGITVKEGNQSITQPAAQSPKSDPLGIR